MSIFFFLGDLLYAVVKAFLPFVVTVLSVLLKVSSKNITKYFPRIESWRHPINSLRTVLSNCATTDLALLMSLYKTFLPSFNT